MIAPYLGRVAVAMTDGADAEKKKWASKAKEDKARREEVIWNAYRDRPRRREVYDA